MNQSPLPRPPRRFVLTALAVVAIFGVLAAASWALAYVTVFPDIPPPVVPSGSPAVDATREATRTQAITATRTGILAALAGLGALITIGINYRNSQTTNRTFRITERGHLTDRYTKAIEQLGANAPVGADGLDGSLAIRLGGIYALQQFAVETDQAADQTTVVEVLSAFVRTRLPRLADRSVPPGADSGSDEPVQEAKQPAAAPASEPPLDVLAAVSALAQLPTRLDVALRADFSGVDFTGIRLTPACLAGANLCGASLTGADLTGADLTGADLTGADLTGADLTRARLILQP